MAAPVRGNHATTTWRVGGHGQVPCSSNVLQAFLTAQLTGRACRSLRGVFPDVYKRIQSCTDGIVDLLLDLERHFRAGDLGLCRDVLQAIAGLVLESKCVDHRANSAAFLMLGGQSLLIKMLCAPSLPQRCKGLIADHRLPGFNRVPPFQKDVSSHLVFGDEGQGHWQVRNECLAILRELCFTVPYFAESLASNRELLIQLFSFFGHEHTFDHAIGLAEELLANRQETLSLQEVPLFRETVLAYTPRQLAFFCRVLAMVVFEPEDRVAKSRRPEKKGAELTEANSDINHRMLLEIPEIFSRLTSLLTVPGLLLASKLRGRREEAHGEVLDEPHLADEIENIGDNNIIRRLVEDDPPTVLHYTPWRELISALQPKKGHGMQGLPQESGVRVASPSGESLDDIEPAVSLSSAFESIDRVRFMAQGGQLSDRGDLATLSSLLGNHLLNLAPGSLASQPSTSDVHRSSTGGQEGGPSEGDLSEMASMWIGGSEEADRRVESPPPMKTVYVQQWQVEVLFVLCASLAGKEKERVQDLLASIGLISVLYDFFDKLDWDEPPPPPPEPHGVHGPGCACNPRSALKIQFLRVIHNFCDRDSPNTLNKQLLIEAPPPKPRRRSRPSTSEPSTSQRPQSAPHRFRTEASTGQVTSRHVVSQRLSNPPLGQAIWSTGQGGPQSRGQGGGLKIRVGLMSKLLKVLMKEPMESVYRFWLASCVESFLRGSDPQHQVYVVEAGLLDHLVEGILNQGFKSASALQINFDLLGEVVKFNAGIFRRLNSMLTGGKFERFVEVIVTHLLDSNVFIRSVLLSTSYFQTGSPSPPYAGPSPPSRPYSRSPEPTPSSPLAPAAARVAGKADCRGYVAAYKRKRKGFDAGDCKFTAFMSGNMLRLVRDLMNCLTRDEINQDNICVLNTTLIFFLLAERKGQLAAYLAALRSDSSVLHHGICQNFLSLLEYWRDYYMHKRGRDCMSLQFSTNIPFRQWMHIVDVLCAGPESVTSL